jgi:lipoate-protein ligase A
MTTFIRIIDDAAHPSSFNMAADLYCGEYSSQNSTIVIRLYEWQPACITIGYMQKASGIFEQDTLNRGGVDWIRRPTGGRAVLHDGDLTYSCIFPAGAAGMGNNVMETYSVVSRCLMAGLESVGISCDLYDSFDALLETRREIKLPCFLAPNRREIMVFGKKLVGSAQKRSVGSVLQHGSIPFTAAFRRLPEYLRLSEREREIQKELLAVKSICLKEINPALTLPNVRRGLIRGFLATLPLETIEQPWTEKERAAIEKLAASAEFRNRWME